MGALSDYCNAMIEALRPYLKRPTEGESTQQRTMLTEVEVLEIKTRLQRAGEDEFADMVKTLAEKYGKSTQMIYRIAADEAWRNVR